MLAGEPLRDRVYGLALTLTITLALLVALVAVVGGSVGSPTHATGDRSGLLGVSLEDPVRITLLAVPPAVAVAWFALAGRHALSWAGIALAGAVAYALPLSMAPYLVLPLGLLVVSQGVLHGLDVWFCRAPPVSPDRQWDGDA